MKKIIIALICLAVFPSFAFGGNAAPYTDEALQKIFKAMSESPKEQYDKASSKEEFHKRFVEYYSKIFETAGYSFNDTIDKIVDDMKNNPEVIPKERQSVYNKVYMLLHLIMYQCNFEKIDCLQFFPSDTKLSVQWLMENSEFSKQGNVHHGSK